MAHSLKNFPKQLASLRRDSPSLRCLFHIQGFQETYEYVDPIESIPRPRCFYCGIILTPPPKQIPSGYKGLRSMRTRDHIIPRCKDKNRAFAITVDCCHLCNQIKAEMTIDEFRAALAMFTHKKTEEFLFYGEKNRGEVLR